MRKLFTLGLVILLMTSVGALAQTATGNVYGKAADSSGAVLPGASVTLAGENGSRSTVTGADGSFRFLNVDPGDYSVTIALQGFGSANRKVSVQTGQSATLNIALKIGGQTETIEVTATAALVDVKKRGTSANLTTQDLQDMPTPRDPWGIMTQVPGALLDRVNIGGNENGQQATIAGKGASTADTVWSLDGLVITDMSATGASPTYFDFGAFQEINVSTGGGDLTMQSGGFGMNLVTKRGTNQFHGSARYLETNDKWQSSNLPEALKGDPRLSGGSTHCRADGGGPRKNANNITNIKDYGFDLGGPLVKDKLWFYGTYGKQDIKNCRLAGQFDDTILPSYNFKLNWQANPNTMVSAFYFLGSKQKFGRGVGFGVTETDDFLWNQDNAFIEGGLPGGLWKLEVNHTFSPSFFMSAKAAYYDTGFGLFPRGGPDQPYTIDYESGQATGSFETYQAIRPQKTANIDGSYFFSGMGGNNELKFGFGYRDVVTNSIDAYSGGGLGGYYYGPGSAGGDNYVTAYRDGYSNYAGKYASIYLGDVFTKDRFTANFGVRIDKQSAKNLASESPASGAFPTRLPAFKYDGSDTLIDWTDLSPRLGFSYALDEGRKTVLRGSLARYAAQLSFGNVTTENPAGQTYIGYPWNDANGDKIPQVSEIGSDVLFSRGINPANPTSTSGSVSKIDRDLKNKKDNEVVLGIDHELGANFAIGAAITYRKTTNLQASQRLSAPCPTATNCSVLQISDYTANAPVTVTRTSNQGGPAGTFTAQTFSPNAALISAGAGGRYRTNFDGYSNQYKGAELTVNKRLSNKWGGRVAISLNDWTEHFSGTPSQGDNNPTKTDTSPNKDGGPVSIVSGGSGRATFYSSFKWQVYANGIVQLPGAFDLSVQLFLRQGGIYPTEINIAAGQAGTQRALVGNVDDARDPSLANLDFRLARNTKVGRVTISPSVELFNALNNDLVLTRARNAGSSTYGRIDEVISPRILRLGARITF
ncbi:MAG: TonB-dependent receptor [Vicinamibacteria bacterium]|nr:TonB-dependent receptor [Vicinamibacteria bacterium]